MVFWWISHCNPTMDVGLDDDMLGFIGMQRRRCSKKWPDGKIRACLN